MKKWLTVSGYATMAIFNILNLIRLFCYEPGIVPLWSKVFMIPIGLYGIIAVAIVLVMNILERKKKYQQ